MLSRMLIIGAALGWSSLALGAGEPKNSSVEVTSQKTGEYFQVTFRVKPDAGMIITLDAPWKLEVKADGLSFAKTSLGKDDLDQKLPGFVVKSSALPTKKSGELEYSLTSFVCTSDKTQCYREVHKGKHTWQQPAS